MDEFGVLEDAQGGFAVKMEKRASRVPESGRDRRQTDPVLSGGRLGRRLGEVSERELLVRVRDDKDPLAREELITRYLPLVKSLARRFASRGQAVEDLIQVGSIGLIKAIDRFDLGAEWSCPRTPLRPSWARSSATSATRAGR